MAWPLIRALWGANLKENEKPVLGMWNVMVSWREIKSVVLMCVTTLHSKNLLVPRGLLNMVNVPWVLCCWTVFISWMYNCSITEAIMASYESALYIEAITVRQKAYRDIYFVSFSSFWIPYRAEQIAWIVWDCDGSEHYSGQLSLLSSWSMCIYNCSLSYKLSTFVRNWSRTSGLFLTPLIVIQML